MTHVEHFAGYGEPVGVHIEYIHEDGYLHAFVVEILIFEHLFEYDYHTVGRSHHYIFTVTFEPTLRRAEEVDNQQEKHNRDYMHKNRYPGDFYPHVDRYVQNKQDYKQ